jgi:hypothetical protein
VPSGSAAQEGSAGEESRLGGAAEEGPGMALGGAWQRGVRLGKAAEEGPGMATWLGGAGSARRSCVGGARMARRRGSAARVRARRWRVAVLPRAARGGAGGRCGGGSRWRRGPRAAVEDHEREGSGVAEEKEKERRRGDGRENDFPNTEGVGSVLEVKG